MLTSHQWPGLIYMVLGFTAGSLLAFIAKLVLLTLVLWIVGRSTVGGDKAKFTDAFWIALIGSVVGSLISQWIPYIGFLIVLVLWLALIKHFFDTGWLGALGIALVSVIVWIIIAAVFTYIVGFRVAELPRMPRLTV
ncbi:MAG: hypothetical protein QXR65_05720 [Candidatus Bathyarchaeia archaeon]